MNNKKYIRILAEVAIVASAAGIMTGCVNKRTEDVSSSQADIIITTDNETTADETTTDEIIADSSSNIESSSSLNESSLNDSSECISDSSEVNDSSSIDTQNNTEIEQTEVIYTGTTSNQSNFEIWENEQYVGEPVQSREVKPVEDNDKNVGDTVVGYTEADVKLLASLINHESSFSDEGRLMVGSVVVNRMNNTGEGVYDTIAAPGQFTSPWGLNYYTDADYEAAEYILENGATNTDVYYFTGCHGDGLNWFTDYNGNWVGAY